MFQMTNYADFIERRLPEQSQETDPLKIILYAIKLR